MTKWALGMIIVLGTILSLGLGLWATPTEVRTQGQLLLALDQACAQVENLQTGSQVLCNQVKERLKEELQKQLEQHKSIKLDPALLGKALVWTAQQNRSGMGADEAVQLMLGLTEMLDQGAYGKKLHELLAYGQAAGYSPEEMAVLVTQLAEMATTQMSAGKVLDKALGHLDKAGPREAPETVVEAIQQAMNNPEMPSQDVSSLRNDKKVPSVEQSKEQPAEGPGFAHQTPSDDSETEVAALLTTDEEEGQADPQEGQEHKSRGAAKKGKSGKGK